MALVNCKECGHKVSSVAPSCPNCGAMVKGQRSEQTTGIDALILIASCIVGLFFGVTLSGMVGEESPPALRVGAGITGIVLPIGGALVWSNRRKR